MPQQVAATMAKKTKQQEKIIKKLEKGGKYGVSGESKKKRNKGRWTLLQEEEKIHDSLKKTTTKSKTKKQSASQSAQGQNSILRNSSRGQNPELGNADSGTQGNG